MWPPSDSDSDEGEFPDRPIHRAARAGDLDELRRELELGWQGDLETPCEDGRALTILCGDERVYQGSEENRIRGLRMLIEAGASVNIDAPSRNLGFPSRRAAVTPTGCSYHPLAIAAANGNLRVVQMLLEAGADVRETSEFGWTALHSSVGADATTRWFRGPEGARRVDVGGSAFKCAAALIAAGADVNAASRQGTTPLLVVARILPSHMSTPLLAVLLRAGATLDPRVRSWSPYLEKVHDAGGWKRYVQAHRKHLAAMFASKLGLPADVLSLVVEFWGPHVGMYVIDAGATKEVENVETGRKSGSCTIA